MRKTYELWEAVSPEGGSQFALLEAGQIATHTPLFEGTPMLLTTFDADSYEEAAQKRNDFLGWGKYHPMKD